MIDRKTRLKIMSMISDEQFAHAPDKDRDTEEEYRYHEGMYAGLQIAYDIVNNVDREKDGDPGGPDDQHG